MTTPNEKAAKKAGEPKPEQGILHIRLEQRLLDDSQELARELGFNLSTHVRVLLRKALDDRKKK